MALLRTIELLNFGLGPRNFIPQSHALSIREAPIFSIYIQAPPFKRIIFNYLRIKDVKTFFYIELAVLTTDCVDVPATVYVGQPEVLQRGDVDDDVIHDVTELLRLPGCGRVAAFDVTAQSIRVVVNGVAGPSERFCEAGVEIDLVMATGPEVRTQRYSSPVSGTSEV